MRLFSDAVKDAAYSGMTYEQQAEAMKAAKVRVMRPIPSRSLIKFGMQGGRLGMLRGVMTDSTMPIALQSIAEGVLLLITRQDTELDPSDPIQVQMVNALIEADGLHPGDLELLEAAAMVEVPLLSTLEGAPRGQRLLPGDIARYK